jgi:hypothetical protein
MSMPEELSRRTRPHRWQLLSGFKSRLLEQSISPSPSRLSGMTILRQGANAIRTDVLHGIKRFLPDPVFLFLSHRRRVGRFPNLKRATTFNEIILNRCLHPDPRWSMLADKLAVREYVRSKLGEKYLIPLLAAPDLFTRDVFDSLPASFVMKANHGCGFVKVVREKSEVSFEQLRQLADEWLSTNFYFASRERHYRSIKPRIYFEKLLLDRNGIVPPDFKINMFRWAQHDPVIVTGVVSDRFGSPRHDFYDTQWNRMDIAVGEYPLSDVPSPRLPNWDEVIRVASLFVEDLGYVRVDLYVFDDQIFFGELTFTPGAGVSPLSPGHYDREWGALINAMSSSRAHADAGGSSR